MKNKLDYLPLYAQVRAQVIARVASGEWLAHEALPSEIALAEIFAVSQGTVRKALTELCTEGWLYRQQGRGTFIAPSVSEWGEGMLVSPGGFSERADTPQIELLGCSRGHAAEEVAEVLGLRRGAPVYRVRQLWRLQGTPVALDDSYTSAERFPDLDARRLRGSEGRLYSVMEQQYGVKLCLKSLLLRALLPDRETSSLLQLNEGEPVLSQVRIAENWSGEALEWRHRLCRSARWAWRITL